MHDTSVSQEALITTKQMMLMRQLPYCDHTQRFRTCVFIHTVNVPFVYNVDRICLSLEGAIFELPEFQSQPVLGHLKTSLQQRL